MFLLGELGFYGFMFLLFDLIVEVDRILNKRDELFEENNLEINSLNFDKWNKDGVFVVDVIGNLESQDQEDDRKFGVDNGLRRFFRKRIQVKKDLDISKIGNLVLKFIFRGKDILKLKYVNIKLEVEKKEIRRSGRGQKKVEKEENNVDYKIIDIVVNIEKKINKDEEDGGKDLLEQEDFTFKNIRR